MLRRGPILCVAAVLALLGWQVTADVAGLSFQATIRAEAVSPPTAAQPASEAQPIDEPAYPAWWSASPPRLASYGSVVIAALLLLLWVYRRHLYILHWTGSWLLRAAGTFGGSISATAGSLGLALLSIFHLLSLGAALLLVVSADTYRGGSALNRKYAWGLVPLVIWFVLAPLGFGREAAVVPGYLMSAALLGTAAFVFLIGMRRARALGAVVVGATLALVAFSHTGIAFSAASGGGDATRTARGQRSPAALRGARDAPAGLRGDDLRTARDQPAPRASARGAAREGHHRPAHDLLQPALLRRSDRA
ncbi:MAG: hypothetical protein QGG24_04325 [Vicinamibacterales bacterium]|jgi:hypothetical protein|nr:hypothetical protein [Vicinamibacterales bacterium]|tara:strand:- start:1630 stop:2550 length:921 start_codon:yes stop_codon:yes gene_type:complete